MKKIIIFTVALLVMIPLLTGCIEMVPFTARGGGWIPVPYEEKILTEDTGKATFGFNVKSYNIVDMGGNEWEYDVKGHFTYIDHENRVKIIGKVLDATYYEGFTEDEDLVHVWSLSGEYMVDDVVEGFFSAAFFKFADSEEGYMLGVGATGGIYDEYEHYGPVNGGTIRLFEKP